MINKGQFSYRVAKRQFMFHDADIAECTIGRQHYVIVRSAGCYGYFYGVGILARRHPYLRGGSAAA